MRPDPDPVSGIVWTNVYIVLTFKTIVMSGKTCKVWSREERATTPHRNGTLHSYILNTSEK
jgi:hypothetical protein